MPVLSQLANDSFVPPDVKNALHGLRPPQRFERRGDLDGASECKQDLKRFAELHSGLPALELNDEPKADAGGTCEFVLSHSAGLAGRSHDTANIFWI